MERVFITVNNVDGTSEKVEVLTTFKIEKFGKSYIVYKEIDNDDLYVASYDETDENEYTNLNTDFTEKEFKLVNEVFDKIVAGIKDGSITIEDK